MYMPRENCFWPLGLVQNPNRTFLNKCIKICRTLLSNLVWICAIKKIGRCFLHKFFNRNNLVKLLALKTTKVQNHKIVLISDTQQK